MGTERIFLEDDAATAALGARIATRLEPGDVVLLSGGLGAGKTTLARALVRTLMDDAGLDVPSPSFALVQPYESGGRFVLHADLYRLAQEGDIAELGLFDRPNAIVLVEWPERARSLDRHANIRVRIDMPKDGQGRIAEIIT